MRAKTGGRVGGVAGACAVLAVAAGCAPVPSAPPPPGLVPEIRLVVVVVTDQFPWSHVKRYGPLLRGGLKRVLEQGVVFSEARHGHAVSETAPGHATLSTGAHPARHGVVENDWFDRRTGSWTGSVEDPDDGVSPRHLRVATFGDRLVEQVPGARVFAASGKDRGAVLLGGRRAEGSYWYDSHTGRFVSSDYYPAARPGWLDDFHARRPADRFFGQAWEPLRVSRRAALQAGVGRPQEGDFARRFPHPIGRPTVVPDGAYYEGLFATPYLDRYLFDLVRTLVTEEGLGQDPTLDLLAVSFSALDAIGHEYGPSSPEAMDAVLRLDRVLGEMLAFLEERVGDRHLMVVLSSDHGVRELPELARRRPASAPAASSRQSAAEVACVQRAGRELAGRFPVSDLLVADGYLSTAAREGAIPDLEAFVHAYRERLEPCPHLARVWVAAELPGLAPSDPVAAAYLRGWDSSRSPDFYLQWTPEHLPRQGRSTTHGSPWDEDVHVPLAFWSPAHLLARTVDEPVATVDLVPTLGKLLGIATPGVDGIDRSGLVLVDSPAVPAEATAP